MAKGAGSSTDAGPQVSTTNLLISVTKVSALEEQAFQIKKNYSDIGSIQSSPRYVVTAWNLYKGNRHSCPEAKTQFTELINGGYPFINKR